MAHFLLDIETVVDPTLPRYKPEKPDAFPPPPYWRIEVAGALWFDDEMVARSLRALPGQDEADRVGAIVAVIQGRKECPTLVTFGGRNFDLPVVTAAAMRAGLQMPRRFGAMSKRYDSRHLDVCDALGDFGGARSPGPLEAWSRTLGWPGKLDGGLGADVGELIATGQRDRVEAYCLGDVVLLAGVFLRYEYTRGKLGRAGYLRAVESTLELARADLRLAIWLEQVDLEAVMRVTPEAEKNAATEIPAAPATAPANEAELPKETAA